MRRMRIVHHTRLPLHSLLPALLIMLLGGRLSAQETILLFPPDLSSFPQVSTWFFPFDVDGTFPEDIDADDFELLEDGVILEPDFIECPEQSDPIPVAATISIDISGSMGTLINRRTGLSIVTDAVRTFVRGLDMSSSVASLLSFNTKSRVILPFTNDTARLLTELDRLLYGEGTDFREAFLGPAGGITVARTAVQKRVLIMFTDGEGVNGDADEIIRRARQDSVTASAPPHPWEHLR